MNIKQHLISVNYGGWNNYNVIFFLNNNTVSLYEKKN